MRERVASGGDPTKLREPAVVQDIPSDEQGIFLLCTLQLRSQDALVSFLLTVFFSLDLVKSFDYSRRERHLIEQRIC